VGRLHHPKDPKRKLGQLIEEFLADLKSRLGEERHYHDLKSRGRIFVGAGFGSRYPDTIIPVGHSSSARLIANRGW
jgi:hypothetical protein